MDKGIIQSVRRQSYPISMGESENLISRERESEASICTNFADFSKMITISQIFY